MSFELHICNRVIRGGSIQELQGIAMALCGEYAIYEVFKSKMWEIPLDKLEKMSRRFKNMTDEQIEQAAELWKRGKLLKEIAPKYNVSIPTISKAIHSVLGY